jgi:Sulfotransferase domain
LIYNKVFFNMTNSTIRILVLIATCGLFAFLSETFSSPSANHYLRSSSSNWRLRKGDSTTSSDNSDDGIDNLSSTKKEMQQQQQHVYGNTMNATSIVQSVISSSSSSTKKEAAADSDTSYPEQPTPPPPHQTSATSSSSSSTTSSSSSWQLPLYIGAGQGTTGTRTLYESMCSLGIPSVHFEQYCIRPATTTTTTTTTSTSTTTTTSTSTNKQNSKSESSSKDEATAKAAGATTLKSLEHAVQYHQQVLVYWRLLHSCAAGYRKRDGSCSSASFDEYAAQLRYYVAKVVDSGIGSVHDVPYAHMVPFIIDLANNNSKYNNDSINTNSSVQGSGGAGGGGEERAAGRGSIVLLTERDPDAWVASRTNHHANSADLICHDLLIDAFDLEQCIDKHHDHIENLFLDFHHLHHNKERQEEFVRLSSEAMNAYQTQIITQYKPAVLVNFWKRAYTVSSLADFVWNSTRPLLLSTSSTNNAAASMVKDITAVAANGGLQFQRSPAIAQLIQEEEDRQDPADKVPA